MIKKAEKVQVQEVDGEGLVGLLDKRITLFCVNYIYTGDLAGVNDDFIKLENAAIVYETGSFDKEDWKDAQSMPNDFYIMRSAVESFGILK